MIVIRAKTRPLKEPFGENFKTIFILYPNNYHFREIVVKIGEIVGDV